MQSPTPAYFQAASASGQSQTTSVRPPKSVLQSPTPSQADVSPPAGLSLLVISSEDPSPKDLLPFSLPGPCSRQRMGNL